MNRPIDVGQVIREVFEIYRDQAAVLLPVALLIFVIEGLVSGAAVAISAILIVVAIVVQVVATTLYQGMVVQLVADVQDGRRDASVADLLRSVTGVLLPLIGAGLLAGLGIALGLVLLILPGLFLLTIWAVVSPVVVLERPGVVAALGRSRELVRGNEWQVFGAIVTFFLILVLVSLVLGAIGAALGAAGSVAADIIGSVLAAPLVALAASVLYFRLRAASGETAAPVGAVGMRPAADPSGPQAPTAPAVGPPPRAPGKPPTGPEQPPRV